MYPFTVLFAPLSDALPVALLIPKAHQHISNRELAPRGTHKITAANSAYNNT